MVGVSEDVSYTPASLLHLFNGVLTPAATKKIILLKGIYVAGRGVTYAGFFYDTLKDETTDAVLTLVVPALLRNGLVPNKTIEFHGYITKRVVLNGGRIEVHAVMTQLLLQTANTYSEKDLRAVEVLRKKAAMGFGDVDGFLKSRIINEFNDGPSDGRPVVRQGVRVRILIGKTAIIDSDISHALEEAIGFFAISYERINLSAEAEIVQALRRYNDRGKNDLLVLSRGGGENMEVFNSPELAACCLELEPLFVTAIGHKEDVSLVQKVADKAFITPTALGQYLHRLYNETVAELQHSKARLAEAITVQLDAQYHKQVQTLEGKVRQLEELNGQRAGLQQRELELVQGQLMAAREQMEVLQSARDRAEALRAVGKKREVVYWVILAGVAIAAWIFFSWFR